MRGKWKKKILSAGKTLLRLAAFLILLCLMLSLLDQVIISKFYRDNTLSPAVNYNDFYRLDPNSADVLILGSSHSFSSFLPQELYDRYGITSFNLGSSNQNLLISYYWLKEALRTQSPKAVVLDCAFVFPRNNTDIPNFVEARIRMALTYMHWSPVKWEAVRDVCRIDKSQNIWSYLFPMIRFHDRWEDLTDEDFKYQEITGTNRLMGFSETYLKRSGVSYTSIPDGSSDSEEDMLELQVQYLDRITSLCRKENIPLILTLTPYYSDTIGKHNAVKSYADRNDLLFINFGETSAYNAMHYDFAQDNADHDHPNPSGAVKITDYLGEVLQNEYHLESHTDSQWEDNRDYYRNFMKLADLFKTDSAQEYTARLNNSRLAAFVFVRNADDINTPTDVRASLKKLGLPDSFLQDRSSGKVCAAVIENGKITQTFSDLEAEMENGSAHGVLKNGTDQYRLSLNADSETVTGGFFVNNIDHNYYNTADYYQELEDGVSIIVYDKVLMREVDKIHIAGEAVER